MPRVLYAMIDALSRPDMERLLSDERVQALLEHPGPDVLAEVRPPEPVIRHEALEPPPRPRKTKPRKRFRP